MEQADGSMVNQWAQSIPNPTGGPWLCYISVSNICNSRCAVCAHEKAMRRDKGCMDRDLFKRIVEQLPCSIKKVYLMKQGEPLLNRNIPFFVNYLKEKRPDVHISFHTNGIIANPKRLKNLLPNMTSLGISISAITAETYKRVHGVSKFNVVIRNLKRLSDLLLAVPERIRPHVFIDYVKQMENASEDENQVAQFFKDNFPGLSSVDFHWVYNYQGEIQEGNMEIYERLPYENFPCCVFPWSSITFCHDGKVSYCFVEPRENRFMGDITTHTFEEIWNGEEYALFRRMMAQKQFGEMANDGFFCQKCSWLWSVQSQSPRNLTLGYSANNGDLLQNKSFGNIMDLPMEDIITHGMDLYLRGEIHQAAGIFNTLASFALTPEMHDIINRMINLCNRVFHKYKDLPLWQDMLQKEGKSHEDRTCRYYPIA